MRRCNACSGQRNRPSGREPPRRDSQPQSTPAPVKGTVLVDVNLLAETPNSQPIDPCSGQRNRPSGREPPRRDSPNQSTPAPVKGTVLVDVNLLAETPNSQPTNRPLLRSKEPSV
ncbi:hypothetical protein THAOC_09211, partial [Thalassiosira oceanica]